MLPTLPKAASLSFSAMHTFIHGKAEQLAGGNNSHMSMAYVMRLQTLWPFMDSAGRSHLKKEIAAFRVLQITLCVHEWPL